MQTLVTGKLIKNIILGSVLSILAIIVVADTVYTVKYGTIAVLTRFGKIVGEPIKPGLNVKFPFVDHVLPYRTQKIIYETMTTDSYVSNTSNADYKDYPVDTTTKDGQQISVRYTVRFSINPARAKEVAENIGTESEVVEKIVKTDSRIWARNIPRNFSALDLYTGNIEEVSNQISEKLKPLFEENGIILDEFGIRSINFQEEYVNTVEQKQIEKEKIATEQFKAQQEEFKKKALITRAQGEAQAQRLQQQTLSKLLIQKQYIEKWNGVLPSVSTGSNSSFLIDINK